MNIRQAAMNRIVYHGMGLKGADLEQFIYDLILIANDSQLFSFYCDLFKEVPSHEEPETPKVPTPILPF